MGAYNRRLQPKELFGLPLVVVAGAIGALVCLLFTLMLPGILKLLAGLGLLLSLAVAGAAGWLGDSWPLRRIMLLALQERGRVTAETRTDL